MRISFFSLLFGCRHKNTTFPITKRRGQRASAAASVTGTYIVCLDCGKEFAYDWQKMKVVDSRKQKPQMQIVKQVKSKEPLPIRPVAGKVS